MSQKCIMEKCLTSAPGTINKKTLGHYLGLFTTDIIVVNILCCSELSDMSLVVWILV